MSEEGERVRPATLPAPDHYPHGVRARYVAGCRCQECRAANTAHARKRAIAKVRGNWDGLVDASRARARILALSRVHVGYRAIAAASDVGKSTLASIRNGRKKLIRASTEKRIMAIEAWHRADHSCVSAKATWIRIRRMLAEGYTQAWIAKELGYTNPALQFNLRKITARNALRVERLYNRVMA